MRVETTTSDSGPVPRSHSPVDGIRLSRFIRGFLLADQVAEFRSPFVVFGLDRAAELLAQLQDLDQPAEADVPALGGAVAAGHLADVAGRTVDAFEDRQKPGAEDLVVGWAAEPAV